MCILFFFTYIYVLLLTRFHHVHVSLLFLFISSHICNDLSEIKNMFCSVLFSVVSQSKFSGPRKFTLRYQYFEISEVEL